MKLRLFETRGPARHGLHTGPSHKALASMIAGVLVLASSLSQTNAATTIDGANRYSYSANLGWMDWLGNGGNGAVIGDYVCSGYIYAANIGWITLGSGSPTNGVHYQNLSGNDFGINHDGLGHLRGLAWSANVGWLSFETNGSPAVDLLTGGLSGSVWSANCGWVSLNNAFAYVQTDTLSPGILDRNGLPLAWELSQFGQTGVDPNADPDGDGLSNFEEYLAGTDPNNPNDKLQIVAESFSLIGSFATLTWSSVATRVYHLEKTLTLNPPAWTDSGLGLIVPDGSSTVRSVRDANAPMQYWRVRAARPLSP